MSSLGHVTIAEKDEDFFYDGLVSLIDLSLRRLTAAHAKTDNIDNANTRARAKSVGALINHIPVVNPFAFHSWYKAVDYEATCEKLKEDSRSFRKAPQTISYQITGSTILDKVRERAVDISRSSFESPDRSKTFILRNAERLAKCIAYDTLYVRVGSHQESSENQELAWRILNRNALPEELETTSVAVVYIIVDVLLNRCPRPMHTTIAQRVSKPTKPMRISKPKPESKTKRAPKKITNKGSGTSGNCELPENSIDYDISTAHCGLRQPLSLQWPDRPIWNGAGHSLPEPVVTNYNQHDHPSHMLHNATQSDLRVTTDHHPTFLPGLDGPDQVMQNTGESTESQIYTQLFPNSNVAQHAGMQMNSLLETFDFDIFSHSTFI